MPLNTDQYFCFCKPISLNVTNKFSVCAFVIDHLSSLMEGRGQGVNGQFYVFKLRWSRLFVRLRVIRWVNYLQRLEKHCWDNPSSWVCEAHLVEWFQPPTSVSFNWIRTLLPKQYFKPPWQKTSLNLPLSHFPDLLQLYLSSHWDRLQLLFSPLPLLVFPLYTAHKSKRTLMLRGKSLKWSV